MSSFSSDQFHVHLLSLSPFSSGLLNEGFDSVRGDRWGGGSGFDAEGMDYSPGNVAQQQQTIIQGETMLRVD